LSEALLKQKFLGVAGRARSYCAALYEFLFSCRYTTTGSIVVHCWQVVADPKPIT
jgi:hypothetical protein